MGLVRVNKTMVMFDRGFLRRQWGKMNRHPLARAGAWLMRYARKSIRRRVNRNLHSTPGTPPYSHAAGNPPPFKRIGFKLTMGSTSVIIGMEGWSLAGPPVPGLQEHGGSARRRVFKAIGRRTLKRKFKNPRQGGVITKKVSEQVRYPKRPFMMPALMATLPKLPQFWANSLR